MQIFEFQFKGKKPSSEIQFQNFYYYPESVYEKRLGYLFVVCQLDNATVSPRTFLQELSLLVKKEYYSVSIKMSPDEALKEALKKGNQYLENLTSQGKVGWLGNLHITIFAFSYKKKTNEWDMNFAKTGDQKVFLARGQQIINIAKSIDEQETEAHSARVFGNIISGTLEHEDVMMVFTQNLYAALHPAKDQKKKTKKNKEESSQSFFDEMISLFPLEDNKGLEQIFKKREALTKEVAGSAAFFRLTPQEDRTVKRVKQAGQDKQSSPTIPAFPLPHFSPHEMKEKLVHVGHFLSSTCRAKVTHVLSKIRSLATRKEIAVPPSQEWHKSLLSFFQRKKRSGNAGSFSLSKLRSTASPSHISQKLSYKLLSFDRAIEKREIRKGLILILLFCVVILVGFIWRQGS